MDPVKYKEEEKKIKEEEPKKDLDVSTVTEFEVTDGKSRDYDAIQEIKELEALFGIKESNPYGTMNKQIFAEKISDMTNTDLQSLAMRVGVPPSRNSAELRRMLKNSFDSFVKRHDAGVASSARPVIDPNSPFYESTVKLLKEGL